MDAKKAWDKLYGKQYTEDESEGRTLYYNKLSTEYEYVSNTVGYNSHIVVSKVFMQHYNKDTGSLAVLDIASGTGLVAEYLRKYNFKGTVDGVDASSNMVAIAKEKGVYRKLWCQFITTENPIKVSKSDCYDGVIISAAFCPTHLKSETLYDILNITKPKGHVVFTTRTSFISDQLNESIEQPFKDVVNLKLAELISKEEFHFFETGFDDHQQSVPYLGYCFCLQKI